MQTTFIDLATLRRLSPVIWGQQVLVYLVLDVGIVLYSMIRHGQNVQSDEDMSHAIMSVLLDADEDVTGMTIYYLHKSLSH